MHRFKFAYRHHSEFLIFYQCWGLNCCGGATYKTPAQGCATLIWALFEELDYGIFNCGKVVASELVSRSSAATTEKLRKLTMKLPIKNIALLVAVPLSALVLVSCGSFPSKGYYESQPRDWDFIQSVGGIRLGEPYRLNGFLWVPILLDVSGSQTITVQPTNSNTGLECAQIMSRNSGNGTSLLVYTVEESVLPPRARLRRTCDAYPLRVGLGLWDFTTQSVYYEYGDKKELIGTVMLFDAT